MEFFHHGAVNGVTGSCHQLVIDQHNSLLIDCGLFQGAETTTTHADNSLSIEFDISTIKAVLLTHSHIDHVGRLPYLLAAGYQGPIYASQATAALLPLILSDALKVGVTRNQNLIDACLARLQQQLVGVSYQQWLALPTSGTLTKVKFKPAGHILGSAFLEVDIKNAELAQRIVFSGDLGAPYAPLLAAPKSPYKADVLVLESTYGDRLHQARRQRINSLKAILSRAVSDNGLILIPAFSMGRTQELLYEIEQIQHQAEPDNCLKQLEIIVDSPLAANFTEQYQHFSRLWDKEAKRKLSAGRKPLQFENLYTIGDHQQHLDCINYLAKRNKPAVIIAASGMCSGGRIVNYLARFLCDATTDVLFIGYQAKGTLGRDIQRFGPQGGYVYLNRQKIDIKARIHTISGYSAHADQSNLLNFIKRMRKRPTQIRLVHGDQAAKQALQQKIMQLFSDIEVVIPSTIADKC